jgi:hypothetical protein
MSDPYVEKMPADFLMGMRAYESFYEESPQIPFTHLSHDYQMHWVRVGRAVVLEVQRQKRKGVAINGPVEPTSIDWVIKAGDKKKSVAPEEMSYGDYQRWMKGKGYDTGSKPKKPKKRKAFPFKTAPDKKWKDLTREERNARAMELYYAKQKGK